MQFRVLGRKSKLGLAATFAIGAGWYTNRRYKRVESPSSEATTETSVEESLVSEQVAHGPTKQPVLFQWSSLPKFIERRYAPDWEGNGIAWKAASTVVIGSVGLISKFFLKYLAHTQVYNLDKFMALADQDGRGRALITVSNHESVLDDPVLWGVLPVETLFSIHKMRWVLGAADICFTTLPRSIFFSLGQAIPTIRGSGIYQPAVDFAIHKANENGWIHIFPEARVNQTASMIRFKWGVGRIIMEADRSPLVIPVWHNGMAQVRPLKGPPIRFFRPITVAFGDPIDFQDTLDAWRSGKITETEARIKITSTIFDALAALKEKTERMKKELETGSTSTDRNEDDSLKDTARF